MFDGRSSMCAVSRVGRWLLLFTVVLVASDIASPTSNMAWAQSDAEHQQFLFAYKLMQRGDDAEAAAAFDEYLGKFPKGDKLGDAQYFRAMLHRKASDNTKAAALLSKAADPTIVPGYAVKLLAGQVYSDLKQYDKALGQLEKIDTADLESNIAFVTHYLKGSAYRASGNLKAAASALQASAKLDSPNKHRALLDLANVQTRMKDNDAALQSLDQCLALGNPATEPIAARLAGDLSYNAGEHDKAIGYYSTVITRYQTTEHFAPATLGLMWAQYGAANYTAVLKTHTQATRVLNLKDKMTAAYLAASAHQELGQHGKAVDAFQVVAQSEAPASIREKALYKYAVSLYELKQYAQMAAAVQALTKQFPQSALAIDGAFLQATAEAEAGQVERGVARLTAFINKGPDQAGYYGQALLRRAHLYETNNKIDAAIADYGTYLDSVDAPSATSLQATFRLMELLSATGKHERVESLANAIFGFDSDPVYTPAIEQEALYRLAVAHRFQGELDQAMATHGKLMRVHPINPFAAESVYEQGLIRMTQGQSEQGLAQLMDAAGRDELPVRSRVSALRVVAQHAVDNGDADGAMKLRQQMQQLGGAKVFSDSERLWIGETLIETGASKKSLDYLSAIEDEQLVDHAKLLIGRAHREAGDIDKALAVLNEVRAVSERFTLDAWLEIALAYRDQGKLDEALRELAALQNPDRGQRIASRALFEGGLINKQLAKNRLKLREQAAAQPFLQASRDALKKLWLLYPDREGESLAKFGYLHLAALQHAAGDAEAEVKTLSELIDAEPNTPHATLAKAVLADRAGKPERMQAYLRQWMKQVEGDVAFTRLLDEFISSEE